MSEGRGRGRRKPASTGDPVQDRQVFVSKAMSYVLRHGAVKEGIPIRPDGYVRFEDLVGPLESPYGNSKLIHLVGNKVKFKKLVNVKLEEIQAVVQNNDKQRFALLEEPPGQWWVKANQGHSIEEFSDASSRKVDVDLEEITDPNDIPTVVHGTFFSKWKLIQTSGLKTMGRTHIHFAAGLPGETGVISGMRQACDVLIYIDAEAAMKGQKKELTSPLLTGEKDGIKFFRSANNVILCPTTIPPSYFKSVIDRKKNVDLLEGTGTSA
ncbi:tRNA 2'-phosphotransferase 1 [Phlyctochytrium bullatum]|nr:tRNA 2'-phosphotransferase 1 [Phlyctochytrium bullatum]